MRSFFAALCALIVASGASPTPDRRQAGSGPLPSYVTQFAPLSHLYSGEQWWPADVATHLEHMIPEVDFVPLAPSVTFSNISSLNSSVFLTSDDFIEDDGGHDWIFSAENVPGPTGLSGGPATIIAVEKPGGIVDAFYFYFYSYDHAEFIDIPFGNHVGDWEHSMVRFIDGVPTDVYLSAHGAGTAYTYQTLVPSNSTDGRAVTYIALGSHANYATSGTQLYPSVLVGPLEDKTDVGPLWDVTLNYRGYWFDNTTEVFTSAAGAGSGGSEQGSDGVGWLTFAGAWGDEQYPVGLDQDRLQYCVADECHFVSGPTGPIAKNLGRDTVCQDTGTCTILTSTNPLAQL